MIIASVPSQQATPLRCFVGVDPGISGAIAFIYDNDRVVFRDMPTEHKRTKGSQVNAHELSSIFREQLAAHPGVVFQVAVEEVAARPKQGVSSMFSFGESAGVVRGVISTLRISFEFVTPQKWKGASGLKGSDKDFARTKLIQARPDLASQLARKKDGGRADAYWIADWLRGKA